MCFAETQHAAGLSKLTPAKSIAREQCRASCGIVENSPVVQPRVNRRKSSPAFCRTAKLPFPSEIKSNRPANDAGLEHKMRQPEFHSGLFWGYSQPCRKKRGTSRGCHGKFGQACSMLRLYQQHHRATRSRCRQCDQTNQMIPITMTAPITLSNSWKYLPK